MTSDHEIHPYGRAGKLRFGMTRHEVEQILGKPDDVEIGPKGEAREFRNESGLHTVYSTTDKRLVEIGFGSNIETLTFQNTPLFTKRPPSIRLRPALVAEERHRGAKGAVFNLAGSVPGGRSYAIRDAGVDVWEVDGIGLVRSQQKTQKKTQKKPPRGKARTP